MATQNADWMEELDRIGERVPFTCAECGGPLWEINNGGSRFRCHNGHAYSLNSLAAEQAIHVEAALWAGVRKLEESEHLARKMEDQARSRGNERSAVYYADMAQGSASHADTLRELLIRHPAPVEQPLAAEPGRTSSQSRG